MDEEDKIQDGANPINFRCASQIATKGYGNVYSFNYFYT
jgi:hypothetical protein